MPALKTTMYSQADGDRIAAADLFAKQAHAGQTRKSGEPYIIHPRAVAHYLADIGMDADTVIAGLLHDTVEDTTVTLHDIEARFGPDVMQLVDGVTKLGQVNYIEGDGSAQRKAASIENVRKLLLAMSQDIRVLMIKLADRRHNLMTLKHLGPEHRRRIARESLDVFAPLADRLGMGALKSEMEDLAFEYADPEGYRLVKRLVAGTAAQAHAYVDEFKKDVLKQLRASGVKPESVHGRQKHLYSIYRKLAKTDGDISKIYDLTALRIIVPTISDCYQVLGIIHQHYRPLIYRIKDYIAVPKPNGYRSLHTTVFAKHGRIIEIQIRTQEMHDEAEQGVAAHALYDAHKNTRGYQRGEGAKVNTKLSWIQELAGLSARLDEGPELMDNLKIDLFRDRIFVFSPMGDLYDLPEGATPVDFAFAVHSDLGLRIQGARVNGRISPLDRPLENRDVVEVITKKMAAPNRQWLSFVKTATARSKIKAWFRAASRESNATTGREMIEAQLGAWGLKKFEDIGATQIKQACNELNTKDPESLLAAVGEGSLTVGAVLRRLLPASAPAKAPLQEEEVEALRRQASDKRYTGRVQVIGAPELPCSLAKCCVPQPQDMLVGYITRGSGVTVHTDGCKNIPDEPDRLLDCQWEVLVETGSLLVVSLHMVCRGRMGMLHDLTGLIVRRRVNIVKTTTNPDPQVPLRAIVDIDVQVPDLFALNTLMQELREHQDVYSVDRVIRPNPQLSSAE